MKTKKRRIKVRRWSALCMVLTILLFFCLWMCAVQLKADTSVDRLSEEPLFIETVFTTFAFVCSALATFVLYCKEKIKIEKRKNSERKSHHLRWEMACIRAGVESF